jgi:hypothetical protein
LNEKSQAVERRAARAAFTVVEGLDIHFVRV